jgi:hypothetical protein
LTGLLLDRLLLDRLLLDRLLPSGDAVERRGTDVSGLRLLDLRRDHLEQGTIGPAKTVRFLRVHARRNDVWFSMCFWASV